MPTHSTNPHTNAPLPPLPSPPLPSPPLPCSDASLQPYLEQIDKIHDSVAALEQTAYRLDAYTKQLGKCVARQQMDRHLIKQITRKQHSLS